MWLLKQIFEFIRLLHTENSTNQLAAGVVIGMYLGFTPPNTLHWFLYFVVLIIFRFNIGAAFISLALFKIASFVLDPVFHQFGGKLLEIGALREAYTFLYHAPVFPFTRFNNSVVMGSFIVSLIATVPIYFIAQKSIVKYRVSVVAKFQTSAIWRAWKATKLYQLYSKYEQLRNA